MDRSDEFTQVLHEALDIIDTHPVAAADSVARNFVEHCRKFRFGETIQDYPDWLDELGDRARALTKSQAAPHLATAAESLAGVIANLSYGATENCHVETAQKIRDDLQREITTRG